MTTQKQTQIIIKLKTHQMEKKINNIDLTHGKPTCLVLACGIGLVSQALKEAGYKCVGAVDYADIPRESFKVNFPDTPFWQESLRNINAKMLCDRFNIKPYELDLIQISTPCIGFSPSGTFEPFHVDNKLFFIAMYLALQLKPKVILFENVPGMTWEKMEVVFSIIVHFFNSVLGEHYIVKARNMNSNNYGDAQKRYRLMFQCVRKDVGEPGWPIIDKEKKPPVIGDVLPHIDYIVSTNHGERLYHAHEAACTITAHANITVHSEGVERQILPWEVAKLMGLDESFKLVGTREQQIKGLGNGVPVGMMRELGRFIKNAILNKPREAQAA